jgi:translation initiation factor 2 subunit 3
MATVLSGSSIADGCVFVIAANEKCPQPQTKEHLMVLEIAEIKNIVIVQNKIDLVTKERALEHYREIKEFVKGTVAENAPVIPISAQQRVNIEYVLEAIEECIPTPKRDLKKPVKMYVARSFDVNKPGTEIEKLKGGVLGGSIIQGKLRVGDEIEIAPGIERNGEWQKLYTRVEGLQKAGMNLEEATAGGLVGVMTSLDPSLTKSDALAGQIVGKPGTLPEIMHEITFDATLLERVVGDIKQDKIKRAEPLLLIVGVTKTVGVVTDVRDNIVTVRLKLPVCAEKGERVSFARRFNDKWRLAGYGVIQ